MSFYVIRNSARCSSLNSSFLSRPSPWTSKTRTRSRGRISVAIPDPAFDPNSPFVKMLGDAIASNPEDALNQSRSDNRPPLLHVLGNGKADKEKLEKEKREEKEQREKKREQEKRRKKIDHFIENCPWYFPCESARSPPPDMASVFLDNFIVCIDYPFVPLYAELIIAQLLYLQNRDPSRPIYMYINSTGTSREDGRKVTFESYGFAIYDIMDSILNEIRTVVMGRAIGQACLLSAAGKKGWRYILPNSIVRLEEPRVIASGLISEADVAIKTKEAINDRDLMIKLYARHSGNSLETIAKAMRMKKVMWPKEAIEFGIADKVLLRDGQDKVMRKFSVRKKRAKKNSTRREGQGQRQGQGQAQGQGLYGAGERGLG